MSFTSAESVVYSRRMSLYVFDGELYAGWSTGRWFGLAGLVGGAVAWAAWELRHGWMAGSLQASDQMFAVYAQYVGAGVCGLMALAALGSVMISQREKGDVEITEAGVRRIFAPGREQFFPREQIAGFSVAPSGGIVLASNDGRRTMLVPRSILGYRDCIAEIKAMGISVLPAGNRRMAAGTSFWQGRTWRAKSQLVLTFFGASMLFTSGTMREHVAGGVISAGVVAWTAITPRQDPRDGPTWIGALTCTLIFGFVILLAQLLSAKLR